MIKKEIKRKIFHQLIFDNCGLKEKNMKYEKCKNKFE